jgi:uncharacterized protein YndB with AHSA1/START domain
MNNPLTVHSVININCTAPRVWQALTDPDLIRQYFFGTEAITDWEEGSALIFRGEWEGKSYEDKGTVLITEPNKVLRYNYWSSMSGIEDKPENYQVITFEIFEEDGVTTLTVTQENIPHEEMKTHSEQNWRMVMNDLKKLLESQVSTDATETVG